MDCTWDQGICSAAIRHVVPFADLNFDRPVMAVFAHRVAHVAKTSKFDS